MKLLLLSLALLGCSSASNSASSVNTIDYSGKREAMDPIIESDSSVYKREAGGFNAQAKPDDRECTCYKGQCQLCSKYGLCIFVPSCPIVPVPLEPTSSKCFCKNGKCHECSLFGLCRDVPSCPEPFIRGVCMRCDKPQHCYEIPCHPLEGRNDVSSTAGGVNAPVNDGSTCFCKHGQCYACSKFGRCRKVPTCPNVQSFIPGRCRECDKSGHCYLTDCQGHIIGKREDELANDYNDCNDCDRNGCRKVPCPGKREVRSAPQQRPFGKREVEDRDPIIESDTSVDSEASIDMEKREAGEEGEAEINHNSVSTTNCICYNGKCTGC